MSIAILTQVYDETRRLAIAGSGAARGDFRLQKLIGPLEQAGAKAPVFAKVAEAAKAVVDGREETSAKALLELSTLVSAILYTQGETGAAGSLEPIETVDIAFSTTQASARVLKPLLEAMTSSGSGRLEVIREALERGAFRDIRLIKPSLEALDDVYGEIADLVADQVLPLYGKAILPELRARFDLKGRMGHARRLQLMHALDPVGTRELVKEALESGSKEVRVAAIACLGGEADDLSFLIEQAAAKAQDVRQAAYKALATMNDDEAVAILQKAMDGKDLVIAAPALQNSQSGKLVAQVIASAERAVAALGKLKEKDAGPQISRCLTLVQCLERRDDAKSEAFLQAVFERRAELAKLNGISASGADLNSVVARAMARGSPRLQVLLAEAHASLPTDQLQWCFEAARHALPADQVYAMFSPHVSGATEGKKKNREAQRQAIINAQGRFGWTRQPSGPELDPRWLDLAVQSKQLAWIGSLIRPGHAAANAFLTKKFSEALQHATHLHECHEVVACMIRAAHPAATDALIAALEKFGKGGDYRDTWFAALPADLPKSALPRLEAIVPSLNERLADQLLGAIQKLREKP